MLAHPWMAACKKERPLSQTQERMKSGVGLSKRKTQPGSPRLHDIIADISVKAAQAWFMESNTSLDQLPVAPSE